MERQLSTGWRCMSFVVLRFTGFDSLQCLCWSGVSQSCGEDAVGLQSGSRRGADFATDVLAKRVPRSPTSRPNCPSLTPATISRHFVCLRACVCAVQEEFGASLARLWSVCCASNQIHSLSIHRCAHAPTRTQKTHTLSCTQDVLILYSHWSVAAVLTQPLSPPEATQWVWTLTGD